ncbi:hypothetical protein AB4Z22_46495, partial [Paenibacillus sp. TAF58]
HGTYTIRLTFLNNEAEYVLSKLRFLGKRVRVIKGEHLPRRDLLFRFKPKRANPNNSLLHAASFTLVPQIIK